MLDVTRAATYAPGTNLRGEATGASWLFALPSLDLGTVVCLGTPPPATLLGLSQRAASVVVVERDARARRTGDGRGAVRFVADTASVPAGSADLVVLDRAAGRRLPRDPGLASRVRALLAPGGAVFADAGLRGTRAVALADALGTLVGGARRDWVTPSHGEVRTAVPADDGAAVGFVLDRRMTARSLDLVELKRTVKRRLRGGGRAQGVPAAAPSPAPTTARAPSGGGSRRRFGAVRGPATRALEGTQRLVDRAERVVVGTGPLGASARRHTVVAGPPGVVGPTPPRYVVEAATADGVDVARHRWALSAPGEYSSRKVLVLLFGPRPGDPLEVVVKLTRDPRLNARLENEGAALARCAELGVSGVPRRVFGGRHAGLALLGQAALDGRPFDAVTRGTADCPHVLAAVGWVTDLGRRTVDRTQPAGAVAEAARDVLGRFVEVYGSDAAERAALTALVERLAGLDVPAVLQHGDPGTWNAMVTPDDRTAFLDWEAAETAGLPLFDLFYLVRTVALVAPGADLSRDHGRGFASAFLTDTALRTLLVDATHRYREAVGVPLDAVEPLWALCWMHRALKEATRLQSGRLHQGHFVTVLRESLARRDDLVALLAR